MQNEMNVIENEMIQEIEAITLEEVDVRENSAETYWCCVLFF